MKARARWALVARRANLSAMTLGRLSLAGAAPLALVVAGAGVASADEIAALRWFRAPMATAFSGAADSAGASEQIVKIDARMGDVDEASQIFAVRGVKVLEHQSSPCAVVLTPGYLDPRRSNHVDTHGYSACTGTALGRGVDLPEGAFVVGLQACLSRDDGRGEVKGLRLFGARFAADGQERALDKPVEWKRPQCAVWGEVVRCPAGQVATDVVVRRPEAVSAMALRCAQVMTRADTPPEVIVALGRPTWAGRMTVPVEVRNSGQRPIRFRGLTVRVHGRGAEHDVVCERSYINVGEAALAPGARRIYPLALDCPRERATSDCGDATCSARVSWSIPDLNGRRVSGTQTVGFDRSAP